jgi:hypothetical protein
LMIYSQTQILRPQVSHHLQRSFTWSLTWSFACSFD